jgi:hypothetical protein
MQRWEKDEKRKGKGMEKGKESGIKKIKTNKRLKHMQRWE